MHTFYQQGKKYAFSPLFSSPFQSFFSPNMLFGHIFGVKQKNIHPWNNNVNVCRGLQGANTRGTNFIWIYSIPDETVLVGHLVCDAGVAVGVHQVHRENPGQGESINQV